MSLNTPTKAGWSDRELLVYLFGLVEFSQAKLDIKNAPRPNGRTIRACEQKISGLKSHLKADLEALRAGAPLTVGDGTPVAKKGRKRKGASEEAEETPTKRGRAKKSEVQAHDDDGDCGDAKEVIDVKSEVKGEAGVDEEV
ncbi:hypothetical protein NX059_004632 [Plenodomus lindquistii]|nr:hypothetical protein NX059_004632 [Plenodomus lindquistii]